LGAAKDDAGVTRGKVIISGLDRGCKIGHDFSASDQGNETTLSIRQVDSCDPDGWYSRLLFVYGLPSPGSPELLDNMTLVSCISGYFITVGNLTVRLPSSGAQHPAIENFQVIKESNHGRVLSGAAKFEWLPLRTISYDLYSRWDTSQYGNLVLRNAAKLSGNATADSRQAVRVDPDILIASIEDIFSSVYATTIAIHGFALLDPPALANGTLSKPTTRVAVVPWAACTLLAMVILAGATSVSTWVHISRTRTGILEDPSTLLAMAGLLDGSGLMTLATRARKEPRSYKGMTHWYENEHKGEDSYWRMYSSEGHDNGRTVISEVTGPSPSGQIIRGAHHSGFTLIPAGDE
jgi:hypothetical protein